MASVRKHTNKQKKICPFDPREWNRWNNGKNLPAHSESAWNKSGTIHGICFLMRFFPSHSYLAYME